MNERPNRNENIPLRVINGDIGGNANNVPVKYNILCSKKVILWIVAGVFCGLFFWFVWEVITDKKISDPKELQLLSQFYLDSLDTKVKPCDDFYAFVCGKAIRRYKAKGETNFGTRTLMERQAFRSLETLLSQPERDVDSKLLKEFKVFYAACTDVGRIKAEGLTPVKELLKEIGGWPLLGMNDTLRDEDWVDVVGRVNSAGFFLAFPFKFGYDIDPVNSTKTSPGLYHFVGYHERNVTKENILKDNMTSIAKSLGAITGERLDKDVADVVEFATNLSLISASDGKSSSHYPVAALPTNVSGIPWQRLLNNIFISSDVQLNDVDNVVLRHPKYNERVAYLLSNTTDDIIKNYIIWNVIMSSFDMSSLKNYSMKDNVLSENEKEERSHDCLTILTKKADVGMGYIYIKEFFNETVKKEAEIILSNVKAETDKYLRENEWMGSEAKRIITENFVSVKDYVAYAEDETLDIEHLHSNLTFDRNATVFSNFRILTNFRRRFKLNKYKMSQMEDQLLIPYHYALEAEGLFSPPINSTFILAAFLQSPLFHPRHPAYMNYGGLGYVIGHEITHGLRILSAFKNITSGPSYDEFQNRTDCLKRQYNDYVIAQVDKKVNGTNTLEENIGDNIGLRVGYNAYKKLINGNATSESQLPNLNYTNAQMYWIAAASVHCIYQDNSTLLKYIDDNEHSPEEARIKIGFGNIEEFVADFNCSVGETMNPIDKCVLN